MRKACNFSVVRALAGRTFRFSVESPVAYVVALFFYGFVGAIFGLNFFEVNQASIDGVGSLAAWVLWLVAPALTMGLISDELRSGTFEQLSTLPVNDWDIVLGKFLGYAAFSLLLIGGLLFLPIIV
jgi:ABC-2 type transport system permease protein